MFKITKKITVALSALVLFFIITAIVTLFGIYFTRPAQLSGKNQVIIVKEGASLKEIASELDQKGLIRNKYAFILWTRLMGYSRRIKAGEYRLNPAMAPVRIINILTKGMVVTHSVTIPEGFSIQQIADVLSREDIVDRKQFITATKNKKILEKYGIKGPSVEGYLYPDTYNFAKGLKAKSIIEVMVDRFMEKIRPLRARINESGLSLAEVVTLASMIEKETGKEEERPLIASVFLNRLKKGMLLESDPTVIYGIKNFSGDLTKKDLTTKTPYNTYVIRGLPPGPIASPGLESLRAVLYPAKTDYLYFVSKNDGWHHFSKTLKEQNRAVYLYQKKRSYHK